MNQAHRHQQTQDPPDKEKGLGTSIAHAWNSFFAPPGVAESQTETSFLDAAREEDADFDKSIPLKDVIYEQLAHRAAYLEFPAEIGGQEGDAVSGPVGRWHGDRMASSQAQVHADDEAEATRDLVGALGYEAVEVVDDPMTGFQAVLFAPTLGGVEVQTGDVLDREWGDKLRPVVAFRGSLDDRGWADDVNPAGIGSHQFRMNEADIVKLLVRAQQVSGALPDVTGHSLGGALAQLAGAHYGNLTGDIVTFQAPGINSEEADMAEDKESRHYRASGDMVPLGGEEHTQGRQRTFLDERSTSPAAHTVYMLEDLHASSEENGNSFFPALDDFHDERNQGAQRAPRVMEVGDTNAPSKNGFSERARKGSKGPGVLRADVDHLNGPLVELSEELRGWVASHQQDEPRDVEDGIRLIVDVRRPQVLKAAEADRRRQLGPEAVFLPNSQEILNAWPSRRDRLIEQTIELYHLERGSADFYRDNGMMGRSIDRKDRLD